MPSIIYTGTKPQKKPKSGGAKSRALAESWAQIQAKYATPPGRSTRVTAQASSILKPTQPYRRETTVTTVTTAQHTVSDGGCTAKTPQYYTGDKMLGIGQLHKSNAVPVFSTDDAIDIARMRRG